jgi:acetyl-CoA synthetase
LRPRREEDRRGQLFLTGDLPKTRSGKIDIAGGRVLGDTTTLADTSVLDAFKGQYDEKEN